MNTEQMNGQCWVCDDKPSKNHDGYSSGLMLIPGFRKLVWICGMCLIRAYGGGSRKTHAMTDHRHTVEPGVIEGVTGDDMAEILATAVETASVFHPGSAIIRVGNAEPEPDGRWSVWYERIPGARWQELDELPGIFPVDCTVCGDETANIDALVFQVDGPNPHADWIVACSMQCQHEVNVSRDLLGFDRA